MARKSSANLALRLGAWITNVKCYRVETGAKTPEAIITHTCKSGVSIVGKCGACAKVIRVTDVQKTGNARGKAATEPKDVICPHCHATDPQTEVTFCGTCDREVPASEIEDRLAFGGHTIKVDRTLLDAWRALLPEPGVMRVECIVLRSTLGTYLFDEAYQMVPDKGSAASFALWIEYLMSRKAALVVQFQISKNFKVGTVYVTHVRGTPVLILHTLLGFDEIELEPFEVPEANRDLLDRVHTLLTPAWVMPLETAVEHPQRRAFADLFQAARDGEALEIKMMGALPGELAAVAQQLCDRLAPPPKKKGGKKDAAPAAHEE